MSERKLISLTICAAVVMLMGARGIRLAVPYSIPFPSHRFDLEPPCITSYPNGTYKVLSGPNAYAGMQLLHVICSNGKCVSNIVFECNVFHEGDRP